MISCETTSSDAILPISPTIALADVCHRPVTAPSLLLTNPDTHFSHNRRRADLETYKMAEPYLRLRIRWHSNLLPEN